jgi:hypothetical protein
MEPPTPEPANAFRITIEAPTLADLHILVEGIAAGLAAQRPAPLLRGGWTPDEDALLLSLRAAGSQWDDIARRLRRSRPAVYQRHAKISGDAPPTR